MKKYTSQVGLILFALLTLLLTVLAIIKMFEVFKNPSYLFVASLILVILPHTKILVAWRSIILIPF